MLYRNEPIHFLPLPSALYTISFLISRGFLKPLCSEETGIQRVSNFKVTQDYTEFKPSTLAPSSRSGTHPLHNSMKLGTFLSPV